MQAFFDVFFRSRVFLHKVDIPVAINLDGFILINQSASRREFPDVFEECEFIGHEAKRHVMPQTLKFHPGLDEL